ncbi:MAG: hypothetical protein E7420_07355 [Ruminococcaceae bacterium]|nr:hypothetical protein [Oscillospiraceae bacterium]
MYNRQYQPNGRRTPYAPETVKKAGSFHGKKLAPVPEVKKETYSEKKSAHQAAPPSPGFGLSGELGKLFGKLGSLSLETEDLLLMAVLYLMYRESGDKELLIMIGALLFIQ